MLQVRIDGVRELTRAIATISPQLAREIGLKNKIIGARIIAAAEPKPTPVGAGSGAMPRASGSRNILQIKAGGSWRKEHVQQWGRNVVPRDTKRPYIWKAADADIVRAEQDYLDGLFSVARRAGLEAYRG